MPCKPLCTTKDLTAISEVCFCSVLKVSIQIDEVKISSKGAVIGLSVSSFLLVYDKKIGMTLDMDNGALEFDVNGKYVDAKFTNLPQGKLLNPSVSAVYGNSLIYYGQLILCALSIKGM